MPRPGGRMWAIVAAVALSAVAAAQQPAAVPTPSNTVPTAAPDGAVRLDPVWKNGLSFRSADREFDLHVGGILQMDAGFYSAGTGLQAPPPAGTGPFADGVSPRRLRIRTDGTFYRDYDFIFELEFANTLVQPRGLVGAEAVPNTFAVPGPVDAWVGYNNIPLIGTVRVGNQREPFSQEQLNGARFLEFMERSFLFDAQQVTAFNTSRSPGVLVQRTWPGNRVHTAGGLFKNVSNPFGFGLGDGDYAATGRVVVMPVYDPDRQRYWAVGGAASRRDPVNGQSRSRVRDPIRGSPAAILNLLAETRPLDAESQELFNLQTAGAVGPLTFLSEGLVKVVTDARRGDREFGDVRYHGGYAQVLYLLTGEHRPWRADSYTFGRVVPFRNLGSGGWGAWEVAARAQYIDLTDAGVFGGRLRSVTLGLNWYWNANTKLQFNWDYTYRDEVADPSTRGAVYAFGTRLAYDF